MRPIVLSLLLAASAANAVTCGDGVPLTTASYAAQVGEGADAPAACADLGSRLYDAETDYNKYWYTIWYPSSQLCNVKMDDDQAEVYLSEYATVAYCSPEPPAGGASAPSADFVAASLNLWGAFIALFAVVWGLKRVLALLDGHRSEA